MPEPLPVKKSGARTLAAVPRGYDTHLVRGDSMNPPLVLVLRGLSPGRTLMGGHFLMSEVPLYGPGRTRSVWGSRPELFGARTGKKTVARFAKSGCSSKAGEWLGGGLAGHGPEASNHTPLGGYPHSSGWLSSSVTSATELWHLSLKSSSLLCPYVLPRASPSGRSRPETVAGIVTSNANSNYQIGKVAETVPRSLTSKRRSLVKATPNWG